MKQFLTLMALLFIIISCTEKQPLTISGKIENALQDYVTIQVFYSGKTDTLTLNPENNTFSGEINLEGEYFAQLLNGNLGIPLYLQPGANIHIELDVEDFKNNKGLNTNITGEGSENSAFMFSLRDKSFYIDQTLIALPVDSFMAKAEGFNNSILEEIEKYEKGKSPSRQFIEKIKFEQKVKLALTYNTYSRYHSHFAPQDTTPLPEIFNTLAEEIPLDNYEYYKELREYKHFVLTQFQDKIKEKVSEQGYKRQSVKRVNANFDEIVALDVSQEIKDELGNRVIGSYTYSPDSIQKIMKERYVDVIKNQDYIDAFKKVAATVDALKPGTIAPGFEYNDIDGNLVTSESLKGKVIYIDVWATWCGPCKAEIPHLQKLEEELHGRDVAFVSISVDNDKAEWEKMVKEKEMGGYQLFAPKAWESSIIKDYAIRGIPRFILVDKEGKLVNANASRPSNPKTKEKLLELADG